MVEVEEGEEVRVGVGEGGKNLNGGFKEKNKKSSQG